MLILLQCNLIDRLHFRSPLVVLSQPIGLELLRKDLGVCLFKIMILGNNNEHLLLLMTK